MADDPRTPMPPLGPPYAPPSDRPPQARYPDTPPDRWSVPPVWMPPPGTPQPESWWNDRRRTSAVWVAIAALVALVAGGMVAWSSNEEPTPSVLNGPTSTEESSVPPTTTPQDLDGVVEEIQRFVERERGLTFKTSVAARVVNDTEFSRSVLADLDKYRESMLEDQQVLTALGLVPPGTDVVQAERTLLSASAVGQYDPETKELLVRGTDITPYVREVIAHELTHALDDQWFNLNRPELDNADDETGFAFTGLAEGDAVRVQNAYRASLSRSEQSDAAFEEQMLAAQHPEVFTLPPVLVTLALAPYDQGPLFVSALLSSGGQPVLDRAFTHPPATSEQIFDPQKYLDGDVPIPVQTPASDATATNKGVLGVLLLQQMLDEVAPSADNGQAVTGWGGDSYVTWMGSTGKTCLRDAFVGDTQNDTTELIQAVTTWATGHDAIVDTTTSSTPSFTICN